MIKYIGLCRFLPSDFQVKGDIFHMSDWQNFRVTKATNGKEARQLVYIADIF